MAKINLLPWRAERREHRKREFFAQLGFAAAAAILLVVLWAVWSNLRIDAQNNRNQYLEAQIKQLDAKITEIKSLQKVRAHLLARKQIVEQLQSSRSQMVHLFDQVVKTIPAGARLTSLKQRGDEMTLDGVAQSNATVAEYMRNIEDSPWMGPTTLVRTENVHASSNTPYEFELIIKLGTPKPNKRAAKPVAAASSALAPSAVALPSLAAAATTAAAAAPSPLPPRAVPATARAGAAAPAQTSAPATVIQKPAAAAARGEAAQ